MGACVGKVLERSWMLCVDASWGGLNKWTINAVVINKNKTITMINGMVLLISLIYPFDSEGTSLIFVHMLTWYPLWHHCTLVFTARCEDRCSAWQRLHAQSCEKRFEGDCWGSYVLVWSTCLVISMVSMMAAGKVDVKDIYAVIYGCNWVICAQSNVTWTSKLPSTNF